MKSPLGPSAQRGEMEPTKHPRDHESVEITKRAGQHRRKAGVGEITVL